VLKWYSLLKQCFSYWLLLDLCWCHEHHRLIVTITVGLNVHQNASKCTISKEKIPNFFSGEGAQPLPDPTPTGEEDTPSPDPTPVGAFGASIWVPSALEPPPDHISGYGPVAIQAFFNEYFYGILFCKLCHWWHKVWGLISVKWITSYLQTYVFVVCCWKATVNFRTYVLTYFCREFIRAFKQLVAVCVDSILTAVLHLMLPHPKKENHRVWREFPHLMAYILRYDLKFDLHVHMDSPDMIP